MPYTQVMAKYKAGRLRSGSGHKVTDPKQAVAVMLSEKRKAEHGDTEYQPRAMKLAAKRRGR